MENTIPENLEELCKANSNPNPVNIAGYGRESTHKGYLSWVFSTEHNKELAVNLIQALSNAFTQSNGLSDYTHADCYFEQQIGNRKVDLLVKLRSESSSKSQFLLPIELKTDSGPSGEKQFQDMSSQISANPDYLGGLVFCLGSSCVQNYKWGKFQILGPDKILSYWKKFYDEGPDFLKDWLEMLAVEIGRKELAVEVYKLCKKDWGAFWGFGYRNYKHLMYYVYAKIRESLHSNNKSRTWEIYDGGYNAVMNLKSGSESWQDIPEINGLRWFFEFNDDRFCLKLEQNSDDLKVVSDWANKCVSTLKAYKSNQPIRTKNRRTWKKGWPLLGDWNVDFSDFANLENQIDDIIESYGINGIMADI